MHYQNVAITCKMPVQLQNHYLIYQPLKIHMPIILCSVDIAFQLCFRVHH